MKLAIKGHPERGVEFTMQQIADKFGISVDQLKIKK